MRVLAFTEAPNHVCARYRIEPFAWDLAQRGLLLEVRPLRSGPARLAQFRAARRFDAVILQRKLLPCWQLLLLRRAARRLIYDVDDAVFQRDSYHPKGPESWSRTIRFWATVRAADAVIAGNHYLRDRVAAFAEPRPLEVVPTCVNPRWYPPADHRRVGRAARLAWIGSDSTLQSLRRAEAHLAAVGRRLPGLELRVICDRPLELAAIPVSWRRWSSATESAELADADIGISWLPDDVWSRGKCGLKVLQYMAAGLPVVANPVGVHGDLVRHGRTGFLAETPEQWAAAVARLAGDPALRGRLGAAARRMVRRRYSVDVWGPRFADLVAATAGEPAVVRPFSASVERPMETLPRKCARATPY